MSDNPIFISVILPVYNTAGFLGQCMDSVLGCDRRVELEVILVDDGSTDGSGALCDDYAARDGRVRVLHKGNGGASSARNAGIRAARGEYLLFVDSDDSVRPGALAEIARRTKAEGERDVILLTADRVLKNGSVKPFSYRYRKDRIDGKSSDAVLKYLTELSHYPVSPCIKLLSRRFAMEHGLFFSEGMACCEDVDHTYSVLLAAKSFNYDETPYYLAREREGSVMTSPQNAQRRLDTTLRILAQWADAARSSPHGPVILAFLAAQYLYACVLYAELPTCARSEYNRKVQAFSWLLAHGVNRMFSVMWLCYKTLGLGFLSWLIKKYMG